ncbi:MAG: hypothetical protein ACE5QV_00440 [Fidelibacterota bacterium]
MAALDWLIIIGCFAISLAIGTFFTRRGSRGITEYFISGRNLPWWVLALSSVATYTDAGLAPAVTMWVYEGGLLGNGVWWIPYTIWMPLAAVLWSKYWRRLRTITTAELIEIRYGGRSAEIYRGIYAFFLSFGFITVLMGYVSGWLSAALKPVLGWTPLELIVFAGLITLIYTTLSGLYGVAYTDVFQFFIFLLGNIIFIPVLLSKVGGMGSVYSGIQALRGSETSEFFKVALPAGNLTSLTILAFSVQGLFFAASPTGGEGFTAQRFMAAKNEFHAQVGQLFNTVFTLIIRVIPFLFLGLIAASVFAPGSISEPGEVWAALVSRFSPPVLKGLIVAGILSAYMSTISTEMNWGASYIVHDLYSRFIRPGASPEHYVLVGRIASVLIFLMSLFVAYYFVQGMKAWFLFINSVVFAFILPLSWLRFFWWRLNIYGEASALILGLPLGYLIWFPFGFSNEAAHPFWQGFLLLFGTGFLTAVTVSLLTPPESSSTLLNFYKKCRPPGVWGPISAELSIREKIKVKKETLNDLLDCGLGIIFCAATILSIISILGKHYNIFAWSLMITAVSTIFFFKRWTQKGIFRNL